ncbi:MAG: helix-turn-helix transcriptional regulator [Spirochaetia bacterium]|nr:helix-turn-helix transcriptional regulator [Spirochaetia bacterium]
MSNLVLTPRFHELLEHTYRLDVEPQQWQRRLTEEIRNRFPFGPGVLSYEFDIRRPEKRVFLGRVMGVGDIEGFTEQTAQVHDSLDSDLYRQLLEGLGTHAATIREALEKLDVDMSVLTPVEQSIEPLGFQDIWGVCSMNPDAVGIVFAVPLLEREAVRDVDRRAWTKVGVHIAAAHRLQRRLRRNPGFEDAEGIFRADGREVQLGGPAIDERDALSRFIRTVDRARAHDYRSGEDSTLDVWEGLLRGRWSLVDHIDSDGAHYLLAIRNDPDAEAPHTLSRREAQVASYAAQGHMNKEIAYELGLAASTVASHLSKALIKLKLGSRTELVWLYGRLQGGIKTQGEQ